MRFSAKGLLLLFLITAGFAVGPLAADESAGRDHSAGRTAAAAAGKEGAGRNDESTNSALEAEIQQLRQELEEQRAILRQQQERTAELEAALAYARAANDAPESAKATGGAVPVPAAPVTGDPAASFEAAGQSGYESRLKSIEERLQKIGPFSLSGDFRLRDEPIFGGPLNQSQVRNRERFRLRVNAGATLNDSWSGGFTLATGDVENPISTNQTASQFYSRKGFFLDRAFINYNPAGFRPLTLTGGKFAYPWYRTELIWDTDLNPEGLAQALQFELASPVLKKFALVGFELPFAEVAGQSLNNKSIVQSGVYGGQVQTVWQAGRLKFGAYSSYYNYHNADPIALAVMTADSKTPQTPLEGLLALNNNALQNSITTTTESGIVTINGTAASTGVKSIVNAQFASKFGLFDNIARLDVDTGAPRWPWVILGDLVQNTRACANAGNIQKSPASTSTATFNQTANAPCDPHARRGYWLESRFGRDREKGDWQLAYTRIYIEREAVMGAFDYSELRQGTNVSQHRAEVIYRVNRDVDLQFTGLFGRPLASTEPFLKRLQFDVLYKF